MTSSEDDQPKWWEKAFGPGPDPAANLAPKRSTLPVTPDGSGHVQRGVSVRCAKCGLEYLRTPNERCPDCGSVYSVQVAMRGEDPVAEGLKRSESRNWWAVVFVGLVPGYFLLLFIGGTFTNLAKYLEVDDWDRDVAVQEWRDDGFTYVEYQGEEKRTLCAGPNGRVDERACHSGPRTVFVNPGDPSEWELFGPEHWQRFAVNNAVASAVTLSVAASVLFLILRRRRRRA